MTNSRVFLVGAGPGDPELLTLKAKRVLESADIVLYDYLVHPNCLLFCNDSAECICVGKAKGKHSQTQDEIHSIIETHAARGKKIVRLKGGDPLIFGRGGEEMAFLKSKGIDYEVIPGISAGCAVPAYAGIPLTHRTLSRSVAFVTATTLNGTSIDKLELPEADTLVFFMAVSALKEITTLLKKTSRFNQETPAALIHRGTSSKQKVVC
ncbi:uroporphyrinogen-III C-methyltransferase, partial [Candidatus Marinamargulisbacteria bacterium SCGC AAA071-K20]